MAFSLAFFLGRKENLFFFSPAGQGGPEGHPRVRARRVFGSVKVQAQQRAREDWGDCALKDGQSLAGGRAAPSCRLQDASAEWNVVAVKLSHPLPLPLLRHCGCGWPSLSRGWTTWRTPTTGSATGCGSCDLKRGAMARHGKLATGMYTSSGDGMGIRNPERALLCCSQAGYCRSLAAAPCCACALSLTGLAGEQSCARLMTGSRH